MDDLAAKVQLLKRLVAMRSGMGKGPGGPRAVGQPVRRDPVAKGQPVPRPPVPSGRPRGDGYGVPTHLPRRDRMPF